MTEENKYWGYHLIINAGMCDKEKVKDQAYLKLWVEDLVKEINMVAFGQPQILHFGHGEPHLAGNTVLQFIETSNILTHFCDEHGDAYVDIFSCKEFDPKLALDHFVDWFDPDMAEIVFFVRDAPRRGQSSSSNAPERVGILTTKERQIGTMEYVRLKPKQG